jgi:hypothetical protein
VAVTGVLGVVGGVIALRERGMRRRREAEEAGEA